jgi:hypothetical protein
VLLFGGLGSFVSDGALGEVGALLHPHAPGGRGLELEDEQYQPHKRDGDQHDRVQDTHIAVLGVR